MDFAARDLGKGARVMGRSAFDRAFYGGGGGMNVFEGNQGTGGFYHEECVFRLTAADGCEPPAEGRQFWYIYAPFFNAVRHAASPLENEPPPVDPRLNMATFV
jgi:hypothetical protein